MLPGNVAEIVHALDKVTCGSFSLRLKGVDVFTPKKPHSLYAGVESALQLYALQAEIERVNRRLWGSRRRREG